MATTTGVLPSLCEAVWATYDQTYRCAQWCGREVQWLRWKGKCGAIKVWGFLDAGMQKKCTTVLQKVGSWVDSFRQAAISRVPSCAKSIASPMRQIGDKIVWVFSMSPQEKRAAAFREFQRVGREYEALQRREVACLDVLLSEGKDCTRGSSEKSSWDSESPQKLPDDVRKQCEAQKGAWQWEDIAKLVGRIVLSLLALKLLGMVV